MMARGASVGRSPPRRTTNGARVRPRRRAATAGRRAAIAAARAVAAALEAEAVSVLLLHTTRYKWSRLIVYAIMTLPLLLLGR